MSDIPIIGQDPRVLRVVQAQFNGLVRRIAGDPSTGMRTGYMLLDTDTATTLARSYRFLRRIESRLRIVRDRSAARLPATAEGLDVMARRLGYRQQARVTPGSALLSRYQEETRAVRECYERVFGGEG